MTGTAAWRNLKHECQNVHLPESPLTASALSMALRQCLAHLEQVSACCGNHQICFIKMGRKLPSKKGNYFKTTTVSFKWSPLIKQGEGAFHTSSLHCVFEPVSHIPFKIHHVSCPEKTVSSQLRNIKSLAGSLGKLSCPMQALKNMEGARR